MFACYEDLEMFIGGRIGKLRSQRNISARDMSLTIGQGAGYINNIENKNNMPSMKGLYYICEFLNITPRDFFDDGTENPALLSELMIECKKLDEKSMENLLLFIRNMKKWIAERSLLYSNTIQYMNDRLPLGGH